MGTRARGHANIKGTRARRKFGHVGTRRLKGTQGTQGTQFNRLDMNQQKIHVIVGFIQLRYLQDIESKWLNTMVAELHHNVDEENAFLSRY